MPSNAHSVLRARSRPIAAVVVIDAELYCDEPQKCAPARDIGDLRLVGYLFNRGSENEVLMRWKVSAKMNGTDTISATTSGEIEFFSHWIYGYPATAADQDLANARALRVRHPPSLTKTVRKCADFPGC